MGATLALGAVFLLGACGGGSSPKAIAGPSSAAPTTSPSGSSQGPRGGSRLAFLDCLKSHGVDVSRLPTRPPDGAGRTPGGRFGQVPPGVDASAFQAARRQCSGLLPAGGIGRLTAQLVAPYLSCIADHGVSVASTTTSPSSTSARSPLAGIDRNDPNFGAAIAACRSLLPARGSGTSTTSSTVPG
ncbi:MAG: hypothetical protein ACYDAD_14540 [Acidimicrobiales bacterium]